MGLFDVWLNNYSILVIFAFIPIYLMMKVDKSAPMLSFRGWNSYLLCSKNKIFMYQNILQVAGIILFGFISDYRHKRSIFSLGLVINAIIYYLDWQMQVKPLNGLYWEISSCITKFLLGTASVLVPYNLSIDIVPTSILLNSHPA